MSIESPEDRDKSFARFVDYWSKQSPEEKSRLMGIMMAPMNKRRGYQRKTCWDHILADDLLV